MIKRLLILLLCFGLSSCASVQYLEIYKEAIKAGDGITITKEEDYQALKQRIGRYFEARGYKPILADRKDGFVVLNKEGDFEEPCQIILKLTVKPKDHHIRIDLVKGNDSVITESEMSHDMEQIANQIRNP